MTLTEKPPRFLQVTLPFPPVLNHYYRVVRGRPIISREGRAYRELVGFTLMGNSVKFGKKRLDVCIHAQPPDHRARDLDGMLKAAMDCLQSAGVYNSDSQIDRLLIVRGDVVKGGKLLVLIKPLE